MTIEIPLWLLTALAGVGALALIVWTGQFLQALNQPCPGRPPPPPCPPGWGSRPAAPAHPDGVPRN